MNRAVLTPLLFLAVVLSGCAGNGSASSRDPVTTPADVQAVDFEGEGGRVAGTVTDTEVVAIAGAQVALGDLAVAVTGQDGTFAFENVPPGTHTLYASALGFASVGKRVEVVAGEQVPVSFLLEPLAVDEGFVEIQQNEGHICFQVGISHPTGATPGIYVNFGNVFCQNAGLIFVGYEIQPGIEALVTEMVWQPTSGVTSRELRVENWQGGARSGAFSFDHRYGTAAGPSPVVLRYGLLEGEEFEGITNETVVVDNAIIVPPDSSRPGGLNVVFDQRTTIYNALFYGLVPDDHYTSLPDV